MKETDGGKATGKGRGGAPAGDREDRLKAALRANLQRRKSQSRARKSATDTADSSAPAPKD
nr:hypothetical protein [Oceanomicrobium pacificus]